ncbi:MAG: sigma-70 family RNA polymerase sigma factor [Solirubrobacteraceae bacterium]
MRNDEECFRMWLAARDAGDHEGMKMYFGEVLAVNMPRLRGFVGSAAVGKLDAHEYDDAVSEACERLLRYVRQKFRGTTMAEFRALMRRVAVISCEEIRRRGARVHEREGSYDDTWASDEGEELGLYGKGLYNAAELAWLEDVEALERVEEQAEHEAFLEWALPQLSDKLRAVAELDLAGTENEQIAAELGITLDTVYQRRRRYLNELRELGKSYPS